jgi:hypothetical protein
VPASDQLDIRTITSGLTEQHLNAEGEKKDLKM